MGPVCYTIWTLIPYVVIYKMVIYFLLTYRYSQAENDLKNKTRVVALPRYDQLIVFLLLYIHFSVFPLIPVNH